MRFWNYFELNNFKPIKPCNSAIPYRSLLANTSLLIFVPFFDFVDNLPQKRMIVSTCKHYVAAFTQNEIVCPPSEL